MSDSYVLDNAWRGAEAFHFYLMAQRQLLEGELNIDMKHNPWIIMKLNYHQYYLLLLTDYRKLWMIDWLVIISL